ncbi:E3 SUMO-protein ligase RanBP2 [Histomonas meleagridis]|uniref:E3 SUMO-protein ligase RanBP2 n=1 Tax=Histomonas meleagridis TaxID=135588 RepID=UPI003559A766|nr:E3 SUMO-protein ligase RanBP2 [Histomonas meleagridis]KAH0801235.1 E3 SUMO-protein ligase RanBP2 [Histomonas meleagridis]
MASVNGWGSAAQNFVNPFSNVTKSWDTPANVDVLSVFSIEDFSVKFHFGTGKLFTGKTKPDSPFTKTTVNVPLVFNMPNQPVMQEKEEETDSSFKMQLVETKTGEEEDEILFQKKARLFEVRINEEGKGENVEIALDILHFNKCSGFYRIVMRRGQTYNCLNARVFKEMNPKQTGKNKNFIRFLMIDEDKKAKTKLIQLETKEDADELMGLWQKAISEIN